MFTVYNTVNYNLLSDKLGYYICYLVINLTHR